MRALRALRVVAAVLIVGTSLGSRVKAGGLPTPGQTTPYFTQYGSGNGTAGGDFVSANGGGGLNSPYHYYIEVPPGLSRLVVDVFDPDVGGANADLAIGAFNTSAQYTLIDPNGTTQATQTGTNGVPASNNAWFTLFDTQSAAPAFQAQQPGNGTALSVALAVPAGTATGDLLVAAIAKADGSTAITAPNTVVWTTVSEGACDNTQTAATCRLGVFYHVVQAGDPASYTFTWPASVRYSADLLRYSGVNTAVPFDASAVQVGPPDTSPINAPTATTSVNNALVMRIALAHNSGSITGTPATNRLNQNSGGGGAGVTLAVSDATQVAAGATGTAAFTLGSAQTWRAVTVAFKPPTVTPTPGHWELRVDTSSAVTGGDDNDGFGIRAHDGSCAGLACAAGGTELNVYADSEVVLGVIGATPNTASYTLYPYVTSGCSLSENDFDFESNSAPAPAQSVTYTSRTAGFSQTIPATSLSANNAWLSHRIPTAGTTWTTASDTAAVDYGIWRQNTTISGFGGGAANYGVLYTGSFQAAGGAPTASPEANSFRQYLPTIAGAAPVKPYLEQLLTWVSGPNPPVFPVVGGPTTYSVTVRLVNPATRSITFSASNLVTANVPAANVTYQGSPQVSQGTVISQPGIGGTGDVTWNPGTVAGGATVLLAYRVAVTPTAPGQRIPVTGVVSAGTGPNGTRARFVDETGNTTQARATMLLGPICELAANVNLITPAVVSSVRAHETRGGVEVEWNTASEVGTVGFDLLRWDPADHAYVTLNKRLLPGLQAAPQGGRYRFLDEGASPGGRYWYVVSETSASGESRFHGPFDVRVEAGSNASTAGNMTSGFDRTARPTPPRLARVLAERRQRSGASPVNSLLRRGQTSMQIGVDRDGLYFLAAGSIASALGLPADQVGAFIGARHLALSNQGHEVAWTGAPGGLLFYGRAIESIYANDNVYWLSIGAGLTMGMAQGGRPSPTGLGSFGDEVHAEENHLAATVVSTDPDADYWYWDFLMGGQPPYDDKSFPVTAVSPDPTGRPGRLRVHLRGATTTGVAGEHHAAVTLNGSPVGEVQWQGIAPATLDVPLSASLIHDGPNAVEVKALLDIGVPHSIFYVDSLDLDYDRVYQASGNTLAFRGDGHAVVTVGGFTEATIGVLDITDTLRPRRVVGTSLDGGAGNYRVSLVPFGPGENYVAATPSSWRAPKWTRPYRSARLTSSGQGADYVVLTTADLFTPARKLAALRQRDGLRTTVVDVADVMDEFNHGISDPRAIQTFLKWAAGRWSPAPRFVLLAGQGTYDYKDYLGHGGNLVPPLMVSTPSGLFASDNHLVDLDGDGLPDLAVGRIPVLSAGEFEGYVQKIQAYEASDGTSWDDRALWVADRASAGADFPAEAEGLVAALPPGYTPERVYLDDGTIVATRAQLMAGLSAGASLMNYVGHGGFDRLASDGLLLSSDVAALTNGGRLPFLTALTCVINRFEVPGFSPLGSELVKSPSGGVSAIWAPTGVSNDSEARALGRRFYAGMNANPTTPIGELVREAVRSFTPSASDRTLGSVYNLLGDPAVVLKSPEGPPAPPPGPSPSSSSRPKSTSGRAVGPT